MISLFRCFFVQDLDCWTDAFSFPMLDYMLEEDPHEPVVTPEDGPTPPTDLLGPMSDLEDTKVALEHRLLRHDPTPPVCEFQNPATVNVSVMALVCFSSFRGWLFSQLVRWRRLLLP